MTSLEIRPRKKAGPLHNGAERGKGSIWHAVPGDPYASRSALCGQYPAIMWSCEDGDAVTCPRCLKQLATTTVVANTEEVYMEEPQITFGLTVTREEYDVIVAALSNPDGPSETILKGQLLLERLRQEQFGSSQKPSGGLGNG